MRDQKEQLSFKPFHHKLDGVFSFIIYDIQLNQVVIGHDPFWIKILYIFLKKMIDLDYKSEMKCLVDLSENVTFYPPGTFSMVDLNKNTHEKHTYYRFIYKPILRVMRIK